MLLHSFDALISKMISSNYDFNELEEKYDVKLPFTYKIFAQSYQLGLNSLRKEVFWDTKRKINIPLLSYYFSNEQCYVSLENFLEVDEALELRRLDDGRFGKNKLNLLRIAFTNDSSGGGIYLSLTKNNFGKIYKVSWDNMDIIFLAEHIFDFIKGIKSTTITFNKIEYDKLYKIWGDNQWKIK